MKRKRTTHNRRKKKEDGTVDDEMKTSTPRNILSSAVALATAHTSFSLNMNMVSPERVAVTTTKVPTLALRTIDPKRKKPTTISMPQIGLGTYKFKKGSGEAKQAVTDAITRAGYRSIDTAFIYGGEQTEKEIGHALREIFTSSSSSPATPSLHGEEKDNDIDNDEKSQNTNVSLKRSDIFLASKQWRAYHGYEPTLQCLSKSLKRLQTDYLDLYLIHWPGCAYNTMARSKDQMESSPHGPFVYAKDGHEIDNIQTLRSETWRAMEDAVFDGKVRAIGVSNFTIRHLEALKQNPHTRIWPPAINQIEMHPYNPQTELVDYCRKEGIVVQAYASLGGQDSGKKTWNALGGKLMEREEVKNIAAAYGKTEAQVLLRWATEQGFGIIPKSTKVQNMRLNLEATLDDTWKTISDSVASSNDSSFKVGLNENEMNILNSLDQSCMEDGSPNERARLCWVRDPLKMLDFD